MRRKELNIYEQARQCMGTLTPLKGHDCGQLCSAACCKGDETTGMLLFPGEQTGLRVVTLPGERLAVCDGECDRAARPLACMFFPFFPTIDERGEVFAEIDERACRICPLAQNAEQVIFDNSFIRAVRKAGKILARDEGCREFMREITAQIDEIAEMRQALLEKDSE